MVRLLRKIRSANPTGLDMATVAMVIMGVIRKLDIGGDIVMAE
jgi:hypothetical protein